MAQGDCRGLLCWTNPVISVEQIARSTRHEKALWGHASELSVDGRRGRVGPATVQRSARPRPDRQQEKGDSDRPPRLMGYYISADDELVCRPE